MLKEIFHQPWRSGWIGKLLNKHSEAEHDMRQCWCQRNLSPREIGMIKMAMPLKYSFTKEPAKTKEDEITRKLIVIPFAPGDK